VSGSATLDLLVLGSGVAGLSAAVRAADAHGMRVGVLTKGQLDQATTRWAQGGVAAVLGGDPDSTDLHMADTLAAGAELCDHDAVEVLVREGPSRVNELIALGAIFDQDAEGRYELAREGGHTQARVLHAGGAATGVEVERALVDAVRRTAAQIHEGCFALDLLVDGGRSSGVRALAPDGSPLTVRARHVLFATGGAGQLFSVTTNPVEATGDGVAMALRAGVAVADIEFVQFHPTALHHPRMPRPLLSEALRGHGALIRDHNGDRFVDELLPRDEVSRAMAARMVEQGVDNLWLDATALGGFADRFPTLAAELATVGLDPATDWLPIAPAAHFLCGGALTDLDGATTMPGLWAAGEAACSGVHGANRLASNSLLEGMVFGCRVVEAVDAGREGPEPTGAMRAVLGSSESDGAIGGTAVTFHPPAPAVAQSAVDLGKLRDRLQRSMTIGAGVVRSAASLAATTIELAEIGAALPEPTDSAGMELANLLVLAQALVLAAEGREESRGAHTRSDHPDRDPRFRRRLVLTGDAQAGANAVT
jgi:L-aspartate oxidase